MPVISNQLELPAKTRVLRREAPEGEPETTNSTLSRRPSLPRKWLHEPLVHFLVAGVILFGLATWFDHANAKSKTNFIKIPASEIQRLSDVWTRQSGNVPDSAQMQNLINDYVREEILYREALASGLDKDDTIIRRRLVEKMEFLSQEVAAKDPSEKDLQVYFEQNREKFRLPRQLSFSHVYFSTSKRGATAEGDARLTLAGIRTGNVNWARVSSLGDPFMLQNEYPLQTEQQVRELFGESFANRLFQMDPGEWAGPIGSGYGFHLVHISQDVPSRLPELPELRSQVLTEFKNQRLQTASEDFYERLRKRYTIEVDQSTPAVEQPQSAAPDERKGGDGLPSDVD